jgi:eukaryotic-like serine/threonine-protein kinase
MQISDRVEAPVSARASRRREVKPLGDTTLPDGAPRPPLSGLLIAAAPDMLAAEEQLRRRNLVRRRLLGDTPPDRIGRFQLLGQVGSGAMSVVYAAYDEDLDRRVAVKLLRASPAANDKRLRREAKAMAQLSHPNVVAVHEIGQWKGQPFIAMELVEGQTVESWLTASPPRAWKEIVDVFLQAGRGLAAAHGLGLVHRDFKPANVMVGEDGRARVLDFGLVRLIERPTPPPEDHRPEGRLQVVPEGILTAPDACPGTPAYMAPEQRSGIAADARSDQFSFCVALHEAIYGVLPGEEPAQGEVQHERPIRPRLARVIARGLDPDPDARWPSMEHLLGALERLRWPARRWRVRAAVLGLGALVAIVAATARWGVAHQRELAHDARLVAAAQRLLERDPTAAAAALREVRYPDKATGWRSAAAAVLLEPLSSAALKPEAQCQQSVFDRNGGRVLTILESGDVLSWRADGSGAPARLPLPPGSHAAASPDRDWLLAWKPDDTTAVLSRSDGGARRTLGEPGERIADAVFTGAGDDVITLSTGGVVRLWHAGGSQVQRTLEAPGDTTAIGHGPRWTFRLGPTGRHVIGMDPEGTEWLWRPGSAVPAMQLPVERQIHLVQLSREERWLVVAFEDGDLELRDVEALSSPRLLRGHQSRVVDFDVSPEDRRLATASDDGTVRVWPMKGPGRPLVLRGHAGPVTSVRFDASGRRLVTTSHDRTVRVWTLDDEVVGDVMVLRGHAHVVRSAAFSRDGRQVVTCGDEPALRLWDVIRHPVRVLGRHDAKISSASLDRGGHRLVTAAVDGTARIWHLDGSRPPIVLSGHQSRELHAAVFSPDGSRVATGAGDGTARIYRADGLGDPLVLPGHHGGAYGLAFSPDGRWLATGSQNGQIRLSRLDGKHETRILEPPCATRSTRGTVQDLIFSPRGDRLVAGAHGCWEVPALLWTRGAQTRVVLGSLQHHDASIAVSPEGRIATSEQDGTLRVWDADGGGPRAILRGHDAGIHGLSFSRDGRRLLSASLDGSARIWDLERPEDVIILRGHEDQVTRAAFDAGERRVVTASADHTARVWNLDEPDQPILLRGHEDAVSYAGFTADRRVVTASFDGTVRLWNLDETAADAPSLMERLRRATTVCLTAGQRMQYLEEPAATARERFAACERAAGRAP